MGLAYLSSEFLVFLRMHGFFVLAVNLSGIFIGTFMLKSGGDMYIVGLFYLLHFLLEAVIYPVMPWLLTKLSPTVLSRIGLVFYTGSYIALLVFRDNAVGVFPLIALLSALGACFYWLPYHIYTVQYTHLGNRQQGMSLMGVVSNFIVLLTPPVSGSIIYFLPGMNGYITVFFVSVVAFTAAALATRGMPSRPTGQKGNPFLRFMKYDLRDKLVAKMCWSHLFYGIRDGLFMYYLNLLIFSTTANEFIIGVNTTGRSILVMITFALIAKYNTPKIRRFAIIGAGVLALLFTGGVTLFFTTLTIIGLSLLDAVLQSYNLNMFQLATYNVSDRLTKKSGIDRRNEVITLRSLLLNIGRTIGLALFLVVPSDFGSPALMLFILSALALPASFILHSMEKDRT
jgi:YQGE family putative transporter